MQNKNQDHSIKNNVSLRTSNKIAAGIALFFALFGIYMLTYRGLPLSKDELFIFDSTESLVRRGDFNRTLEYGKYYNFNTLGEDGNPFPPPNQEPLMSVVIAPLYWVGQSIPEIGIIHTVWHFNIFLTALTAVSLYGIGTWLGYSPRVAWMVALMYGIGTIAWVYSRTLFREPLMAFFVLWCFAFALKIHVAWGEEKKKIPWRLLGLLILSFLGAFLTKVASIVLLPGILIIILPPFRMLYQQKRWWLGVGGLGIALFLLMVIVVQLDNDTRARYSLEVWLQFLENTEWESVLESFLGYHFSFGRSVWLYSPILVLGIGGLRSYLQMKQWRFVVGSVFTLLFLSGSYGIAHGFSWWGGWGWGPRYMIPLIPVMMLWLLPMVERIQKRWQIGMVVLLATLSASLQVLGMSVRLSNYYTDLTYNNKIAVQEWRWMEFNWQWEWSPIRYHLERFDLNYLDVAWLSADPTFVSPLLALWLGSLGLIWGVYTLKNNAQGIGRWEFRRLIGGTLFLFMLSGILVGQGLLALRDDPRYTDDLEDVVALLKDLDNSATNEDAIFLDREQYTLLFMNYFKTPTLLVTLPYAPGERYSDAPPKVGGTVDWQSLPPATQQWIEANGLENYILINQISYETYYTLNWTADRYPRLWLIASSSPFEPNKIRPIEHYLSLYYFPINESEITESYRARALAYLTVDAPQGEPTIKINACFSQFREFEGFQLPQAQLLLTGIDLPSGTEFKRGEVIPISLQWQALTHLPEDYRVSVQLAPAINTPNIPVTQRDGIPQATFGFMTQWTIGNNYRDNYGLIVPTNAPTGNYQIQIVVYSGQTGQRLTVIHSEGLTIDNVVISSNLTIR